MYISDEKAFGYLGVLLLICLPWLGIKFTVWGLVWDLLIIGALFAVGRRQGLRRTAIFLALGYGVALAYFKTGGMAYMSYVPWAGLWVLLGREKNWPEPKTLILMLATAGILGVLPVLPFFMQNLAPEFIDKTVQTVLQQYDSAGMLSSLQREGISAAQVSSMLERFISFYFTIIPAVTVLFSALEIGGPYLFVRKWFLPGGTAADLNFTRWRIPWQAIWTVIVALVAYLLGGQIGWRGLELAGINLIVVCAAVSLALGISNYAYFLTLPKVPRLLKIITLLMNLFYFFFTAIILILIGTFDLVFNFRHLPEKGKESK